MPIFDDKTRLDTVRNPDDVPGRVVVGGVNMRIAAGKIELAFHHHRKSQLFFVVRGLMTCESRTGLWTVPPQSAMWIPAKLEHRVQTSGALEAYFAFIEPAAVRTMPKGCATVEVSPLLRELLVRCAALPLPAPATPAVANLHRVILDEIRAAPIEDLHLPMPTDPRVRTLAELITKRPADPATMDIWAKRIGVSPRSLSRILTTQTGMSFGRWRQQLHIILALRWLSAGAPVQSVAIDLGYDDPGSFITMFRKALGLSPARFMARRLAAMQRAA